MSGGRLTWLVARREIREGVRGRTFLVSSIVVLAILGGVIALPAIVGSQQTVEFGVVGTPPAQLEAALRRAAEPFDTDVALRRYGTLEAAREAVAGRKVDAALLTDPGRLLVRQDPDGDVVTIASIAARSIQLPGLVDRLGVTRAQAEALLAPPLAVREVEAATGADDSTEFLAYGAAILLFISLSVYGQAVMMSVVQEKASRVVEVLLASLRPRHLLAGKVAGVGALGLAQIAIVAIGAVAADRAGVIDVPSLGRTAPLALLWFLLGYVLYAVAFASAGALVSRIEDASSASLPITMTMLAAYLVSFGTVGANPDGAGAVVMTILPVSAPFVLPARVAVTDVALWEHALALALMLVAIYGLVRLGGRVYELALLRTGARVPFREALRPPTAG